MKERNAHRAKLNPWPYAIAGYFIVFIAFIAAFIAWGVRQNMDLVDKDYYADEILFQKRIDTVARTTALNTRIDIEYDVARHCIMVQVPEAHAHSSACGRIQLYRPSDARQDREISLKPDARGVQSLDASALPPGLWKVRLQWRTGGEDYYFAKQIVIGG